MRTDRLRQEAISEALELADIETDGGSVSFLGQTTTITTYPTTAGLYYAVTPLSVGGSEAEGSTATFTSESGTVMAYNVGSTVPPNGTKVLVSGVGGRWVFRWDG
jgi:hypothetical protein